MEQQLNHAGSGERTAQTADHSETYSITELAEEFAITTRAIRFYEDKGLLHPSRDGQTRVYQPRDRARLTLIVRGRLVGFTLAEIKEIIDLYNLEDGGEAHYRQGLAKMAERIESLQNQKQEIDKQIETLNEGVSRIQGLLGTKFGRVN